MNNGQRWDVFATIAALLGLAAWWRWPEVRALLRGWLDWLVGEEADTEDVPGRLGDVGTGAHASAGCAADPVNPRPGTLTTIRVGDTLIATDSYDPIELPAMRPEHVSESMLPENHQPPIPPRTVWIRPALEAGWTARLGHPTTTEWRQACRRELEAAWAA